MARPELRPMSVGEILDRTASLYRDNFGLFFGISLVPHAFVLAWALVQVALQGPPPLLEPRALRDLIVLAGFIVEAGFTYLFTQGSTAFAVSELYLGRGTSIRASLIQVVRRLGGLTRCILLNGFTLFVGAVLFLLPGVFFACRLMVALPAAVLEDLGARQSFRRSFSLTRNNTSRALGIYALYFSLRIVGILLLFYPSGLVTDLSHVNPGGAIVWRDVVTFLNVLFATLVDPFLTIAAAVFYFDLRVRKEALDLQLMMSGSEKIPERPIAAPSI